MTALSPPPGFEGPLQQSPQQPQAPQADKIKRPRDRRVSWATGENLCQVRLFAAEDAPTLSGSIQEQLQAKQARNCHIFNSVIPSPVSDAPPGFGGVPVKPKPDHIALAAIVPQIPWRPPSTVYLDPTWHVMAGGASLEIGLQKQREVRILEAVYPRPSSIPESPAEPVETQEPYDDSVTPQIPLVPLEEEDVPDGNDMSSPSLGPRFLAHGSSGQVGGAQSILANASSLSNSRPEKVKQYLGNNLPGQPTQETSNSRKETAWWDASTLHTLRPSAVHAAKASSALISARPFMDNSSDSIGGRPPPAGPLADVHANAKFNTEPDVAAAAATALAVLAKSQEMGSMIDKELLIKVLSDPGLIQSLTSKQPFTISNSKSELSSSVTLNGASRGPAKLNQAQLNSLVTSGNHWMSPPSTSYIPVPTSGQEVSRSRSGEAYSIAGERFQRTAGLDERSTLLHGSIGSGLLYTDTASGRVGSGTVPRPSINGDSPPGFGPKSGSQHGVQAVAAPQVGAATSRPLSRVDEQYYKSLIMQHGCKSADDDDHGRAGKDNVKGSSGAKTSTTYSTEVKRWYGREEFDVGRSERNGREGRDGERTVPGPSLETTTRAKSRKVCIYFGTPRGCRNGDNCTFVHELSESKKGKTERSAPSHLPYAKRLKVDG